MNNGYNNILYIYTCGSAWTSEDVELNVGCDLLYRERTSEDGFRLLHYPEIRHPGGSIVRRLIKGRSWFTLPYLTLPQFLEDDPYEVPLKSSIVSFRLVVCSGVLP